MPARAMGIGSGRPPAEAASMFKDLLVPVVLGEVSTEAFEVACTLAAHDGGRVTGLVALSAVTPEIGRASRRERVCPYGLISAVAVSLQKKSNKISYAYVTTYIE